MTSSPSCLLAVIVTSKEEEMEMGYGFNVSMRAWRSVKRVAFRLIKARRKLGTDFLPLKRKVCRISDARKSGNGRHVLLNYDMLSYSKNFDDGSWQQEDVDYYSSRSFAYRFGQSSSLAF